MASWSGLDSPKTLQFARGQMLGAFVLDLVNLPLEENAGEGHFKNLGAIVLKHLVLFERSNVSFLMRLARWRLTRSRDHCSLFANSICPMDRLNSHSHMTCDKTSSRWLVLRHFGVQG